jgi:hypothetical protein
MSRSPSNNEKSLILQGWSINSQFRCSLLSGCSFREISLNELATRAEVNPDKVNRFVFHMEDGILTFNEMTRLAKVTGLDSIRIEVWPEDLHSPSPPPDQLDKEDLRPIA